MPSDQRLSGPNAPNVERVRGRCAQKSQARSPAVVLYQGPRAREDDGRRGAKKWPALGRPGVSQSRLSPHILLHLGLDLDRSLPQVRSG